MGRHLCKQRKGQILVVAVLLIALLILSTQLYIHEVGRSSPTDSSSPFNDLVFSVKLGSEHTVTSLLANRSRGGARTLSDSLSEWATFTESMYQFGTLTHSFQMSNKSPYTNGTHLTWGTGGVGISSAFSEFNLSLSGRQAGFEITYEINITTSISMAVECKDLHSNLKKINVTCTLFNEGFPALANNLAVFFKDPISWNTANDEQAYSFIDYGNGTYLTQFEVYLSQPSVDLSVQAYDLRGVYVQANMTCITIP